jgi:hypothetical protein
MAAGEAVRETRRKAAERTGEPLKPPKTAKWPDPGPESPRAYRLDSARLFSAKRLVHLGQIADAMARVVAEGEPALGFRAAMLGKVLPFLEYHGIAFLPAARSRPGDLFLCLPRRSRCAS